MATVEQCRQALNQIAAKLSKTGTAGYIVSFPIPEVIMGINSFMLGAQSVNPDFKIAVSPPAIRESCTSGWEKNRRNRSGAVGLGGLGLSVAGRAGAIAVRLSGEQSRNQLGDSIARALAPALRSTRHMPRVELLSAVVCDPPKFGLP